MNYLKERDGDLFSNADLKQLIVPLLIEQLLAIAVGMADSIMVSSVGEAAVSSVSLIDTIFILLINMFTAIATGGAVVCGQYIGKKRPHKACEAADQLLLVTTALSVVIMRRSIFKAVYSTCCVWKHYGRGRKKLQYLSDDRSGFHSVSGGLQRLCGHFPRAG